MKPTPIARFTESVLAHTAMHCYALSLVVAPLAKKGPRTRKGLTRSLEKKPGGHVQGARLLGDFCSDWPQCYHSNSNIRRGLEVPLFFLGTTHQQPSNSSSSNHLAPAPSNSSRRQQRPTFHGSNCPPRKEHAEGSRPCQLVLKGVDTCVLRKTFIKGPWANLDLSQAHNVAVTALAVATICGFELAWQATSTAAGGPLAQKVSYAAFRKLRPRARCNSSILT